MILKKLKIKTTKKKKLKIRKPKTLIGWKEWCALPELGLPAIRAKVDTGARTSALHAFDIEIFKKRGERYVRFKVLPLETCRTLSRTCVTPLIEERVIISSNGEREMRPVIMADIVLGDTAFTTELTLTSRHKMNFRMLLGRKALRKGRFAVDPAKSFLQGVKLHPETLYRKHSPRGSA
jgi:hypothetical protein